jgi:hypothetical protein
MSARENVITLGFFSGRLGSNSLFLSRFPNPAMPIITVVLVFAGVEERSF